MAGPKRMLSAIVPENKEGLLGHHDRVAAKIALREVTWSMPSRGDRTGAGVIEACDQQRWWSLPARSCRPVRRFAGRHLRVNPDSTGLSGAYSKSTAWTPTSPRTAVSGTGWAGSAIRRLQASTGDLLQRRRRRLEGVEELRGSPAWARRTSRQVEQKCGQRADRHLVVHHAVTAVQQHHPGGGLPTSFTAGMKTASSRKLCSLSARYSSATASKICWFRDCRR